MGIEDKTEAMAPVYRKGITFPNDEKIDEEYRGKTVVVSYYWSHPPEVCNKRLYGYTAFFALFNNELRVAPRIVKKH